jgi:hypothetical protein
LKRAQRALGLSAPVYAIDVMVSAAKPLHRRALRRNVHDFRDARKEGREMKTWIVEDPSFAMRALSPSAMS